MAGRIFIGTLYEEGLGVAPDNTEALKWYKKAADLKIDKRQSEDWMYLTSSLQKGENRTRSRITSTISCGGRVISG